MKPTADKCSTKGLVNFTRLADRLGMTVHQSLLERRLHLAFVVGRSGLGPDEVADIIGKARLPNSEEVREQVDLCRSWLVRQGLCSQ